MEGWAQPVCYVQNAPFHKGEGKRMMMCVLTLPVCFARPHGMFIYMHEYRDAE